MTRKKNDTWDGTVAHARALQEALAERVQLKDGFAKPLATIGGVTVSAEDEGARLRAVAVLVDAETMQLIDAQVAHVKATTPYVPGFLSFRVMPALLKVMSMLPSAPDLVLFDGDGLAHPHRFGIASHFGVATGLPTIGVAPRPLLGTAMELHTIRGAYTALREHGQQIGWLLRSQAKAPPIVVSPGHRVAMPSVADLCMRFTTDDRMPEPLRMAQMLGASTPSPAGKD
jgi:deoxyribonuclease V